VRRIGASARQVRQSKRAPSALRNWNDDGARPKPPSASNGAENHAARRNSPSVIGISPTSSCMRIAAAIADSSAAR
jgi:hypothetical protein